MNAFSLICYSKQSAALLHSFYSLSITYIFELIFKVPLCYHRGNNASTTKIRRWRYMTLSASKADRKRLIINYKIIKVFFVVCVCVWVNSRFSRKYNLDKLKSKILSNYKILSKSFEPFPRHTN